MTLDEALDALRAAADPTRTPGMARVGINVERALGVSVPAIRRIARRAGTDHRLARALWTTGIHEARFLATLVADPAAMTDREMDRWAQDLDSWDVGDAAADLFAATPSRDAKIASWSRSELPYVKRAAFAMIARRAVSDRTASDAAFRRYLATIRRAAHDDRNEVRKGISWALRQIGKRNLALHADAVATAERIAAEAERSGSRGGRWVARDVLRELRSDAVRARLGAGRRR
ncbi:MAG TPA: DNA alkylation repair protein [Actinomycetota bacterium]|nr:DNA alkylation repair protein [Actinomycetota bacterium]